MLGRNLAYLQQFVRRGTPRRLAENDRRLLAEFFGVDETLLGGPATEREVAVPYLTVAASAGRGAAASDERLLRSEHFTARLLRDAGVTPASASLIDATGDSMVPTILSGDRLLVDRNDTAPAANGIFVVRRGEELLVKRVAWGRTGMILQSDNADYAPIVCEPGDAIVIGRVKLLIRAT